MPPRRRHRSTASGTRRLAVALDQPPRHRPRSLAVDPPPRRRPRSLAVEPPPRRRPYMHVVPTHGPLNRRLAVAHDRIMGSREFALVWNGVIEIRPCRATD